MGKLLYHSFIFFCLSHLSATKETKEERGRGMEEKRLNKDECDFHDFFAMF